MAVIRQFEVFALAAVSLVVLGCSREGTREEPAPVESQGRSLDTISDSDTIVSLNRWRLTKGDFIDQRELRKSLMKVAMGDNGYKTIAKSIDENIRLGFLDTFIQEKLLQTAAEDFFATNSNAEAVSAARTAALEKIHSTFSISGTNGVEKTFEDIVAALPDDATRKLFESSVNDNATIEAFMLCAFPDEMSVPDDFIEKRLAYLAEYNLRVAATNALQYALATNLHERIAAGADFASIADEFSQDPERTLGGDIGERVEADFADDPETWEVLAALEQGEVTQPLHTMQGIEIFKLIEKVPAERADAQEDSLRLAHVMLRLGVQCRDYTPSELKAEMEENNRAKRTREVLSREWKRVKIEFPNGAAVLPSSVWAKMPGFPK